MMMPKTATPTAYPLPGTFAVAQQITLLCETPGAVIRYTLDGSSPTDVSAECTPDDLPMLAAINEGTKGIRSEYVITAQAIAPECAPSDVVTFAYCIDRRDTDSYIAHEVMPGLWQIRDYDDTNMYLVKGQTGALLFDAGMGNGQLRALVHQLIGDMPLTVCITHGHPDHVAALGQFEDAYDVYMSHRHLPMVRSFGERLGMHLDLSDIIDIREGMVFDIGDWRFEVLHVPGHSQGSMVFYEANRRLVIAGDAFGSNTPTVPHALWMQIASASPIDHYLSSLRRYDATMRGRVDWYYGGHNDGPLDEAYLQNLIALVQQVVDEQVPLTPSLRPRGGWWVQRGNRVTDADWVAINLPKDNHLSVPSIRIATLANIAVQGGVLSPAFTPDQLTYTIHGTGSITIVPVVTVSDYTSLTVNDVVHQSGQPYVVDGDTVVIRVVAADGAMAQRYHVHIVNGVA